MVNTQVSIVDVQQSSSSPSTLAVSAEHIAQFNALLKSTQQMSSASTPAFERKTDASPSDEVGVFQRQVYKVQESEFFVERLQRHIKGSIEDLRIGHTMDGAFARSVSNLTFASSYYFLGTSRVASTAQDISDEVSSVTRGK
ncbi:MAG TPA: hypothetical protein VFV39_01945 [Limnobacter sp.]|nr:hypothetical protein [Limnobacter sp.]